MTDIRWDAAGPPSSVPKIEMPLDFLGFHADLRVPFQRFAHKRLGSREDAEDVVDETFLRIHVKWNDILASASPRAFAWKILRNQITDHLRRRKRRPVILQPTEADRGFDSWTLDLGTLDALLLRIDVHRAIETLPPKQAECIQLTYLLGYSHAEAASIMGVRPTTVASQLQSARRTLEKKLRAHTAPAHPHRKDRR